MSPDTPSTVRGARGDEQPQRGEESADTRQIAPRRPASRAPARRTPAPRNRGAAAPREEEREAGEHERRQILAPRHRRRHQPLEQMLSPGVHDGEPDAPDPAAHQVHAQQARHHEIHVARARLAHPALAGGHGIRPPGRALHRCVHQQPGGPRVRPLRVVAVFVPPAPGAATSATSPVRSASAAAVGEDAQLEAVSGGEAPGERAVLRAPFTRATGVRSGGRLRKAIPRPA